MRSLLSVALISILNGESAREIELSIHGAHYMFTIQPIHFDLDLLRPLRPVPTTSYEPFAHVWASLDTRLYDSIQMTSLSSVDSVDYCRSR